MADSTDYDPKAFHEFEHASWEAAAPFFYDNLARTTSQVREPMLDAVGAGEGVRLLDVASGPGWLAAAAAARGARARGLDFSAAMVAEARRRYPYVDYREGNAEALPFEDGAFDAVVCAFGMHHLPHPDEAASEFHRVLASGGRFAFTSWCLPSRSPFRAIFQAALDAHGDPDITIPGGPPQFHFDDPEACRTFLGEAGFTVESIMEVPVVVRIDSPEAAIEPSLKGGGRSRALLLAQSEQARARISAAMAEGARKYEKDGKVEIPRPALLVSASKT